jgi:hypothetical protein
VNLKLTPLAKRAIDEPVLIVVSHAAEELRARGLLEELEWLANRIDRELVAPLLESVLRSPRRLTILAPSALGQGLSLTIAHETTDPASTPFDERALEEPLPTQDLDEAVRRSLS